MAHYWQLHYHIDIVMMTVKMTGYRDSDKITLTIVTSAKKPTYDK